MKLSRAIELCHEPLKRSRSHIVEVDRYALVHLMADRDDLLKEIGRLNGANDKLAAEIRALRSLAEETAKAATEA